MLEVEVHLLWGQCSLVEQFLFEHTSPKLTKTWALEQDFSIKQQCCSIKKFHVIKQRSHT